MRDLERRARRTAVLNSSVITAFCLASSQIMTYKAIRSAFGHDLKKEGRTLFCENFGFLPPPTRARKL
jgi:hypothetical protein